MCEALLPTPNSRARVFERFDQEEDFGGHPVVQIRGVGAGAVAAAGDDALEGLGERAEPRGFGIGGELLEDGRSRGGVPCEQGLRHGEADAAVGVVMGRLIARSWVQCGVADDDRGRQLGGRAEAAGIREHAGPAYTWRS